MRADVLLSSFKWGQGDPRFRQGNIGFRIVLAGNPVAARMK
jgi:hypothetical protein